MNIQKLAAELFDLFERVQHVHLRHPTIFNYKERRTNKANQTCLHQLWFWIRLAVSSSINYFTTKF